MNSLRGTLPTVVFLNDRKGIAIQLFIQSFVNNGFPAPRFEGFAHVFLAGEASGFWKKIT